MTITQKSTDEGTKILFVSLDIPEYNRTDCRRAVVLEIERQKLDICLSVVIVNPFDRIIHSGVN